MRNLLSSLLVASATVVVPNWQAAAPPPVPTPEVLSALRSAQVTSAAASNAMAQSATGQIATGAFVAAPIRPTSQVVKAENAASVAVAPVAALPVSISAPLVQLAAADVAPQGKAPDAKAPQKATQAPAAAATPPAAPVRGSCANPDALGVSRTVEIDTTGGPGFGLEQYKAHDFLAEKEVVLTFDDGPQVGTTKAVLEALAHHCTRAIFFSIGKMAVGMPDLIREVARQGHTVGTHTWSHADMGKKKTELDAKDEIERGVSGVRRAVGGPIAPFFRFPFLRDSKEAIGYLGTRNIAIFSTDVDSFDFKPQTPEHLVAEVMKKLEKRGKGILLMHDIHKTTAKALPALLDALKAKGFKIVHMKPAGELKTVAEYDTLIEKDVKGLPGPGSDRPTSSIVKTVPSQP